MARANGVIPRERQGAKFRDWTDIYDSIPLSNGAFVGKKEFFQIQRGGNNGVYIKTDADTNLTASGQITAGNAFEIHYINFMLLGFSTLAGIPVSVLQLVNARCDITLKINNITRFQSTWQRIPLNYSINIQALGQAAAAQAVFPASNSWAQAPNGKRFEFPHTIHASEAFSVELNFVDSTTLASMEANSRLVCTLVGLQNKPT